MAYLWYISLSLFEFFENLKFTEKCVNFTLKILMKVLLNIVVNYMVGIQRLHAKSDDDRQASLTFHHTRSCLCETN